MDILSVHINAGLEYLSSLEQGGIFPLFGDSLRHGDSIDWTSACMGSTFAEIDQDHPTITRVKNVLLRLRRADGGWAYNEKVPSDPDSTLRVLQFFQKIGFDDSIVLQKGYQFILKHQDPISGGIRTYTPETLKLMGYAGGGWDQPHICVSALAYNILPNCSQREKLKVYLEGNIRNSTIAPYWWTISNYTRWELRNLGVSGESPRGGAVDISLFLMTAKKGDKVRKYIDSLLSLQQNDGSFAGSGIFQIPVSTQSLNGAVKASRVIPDTQGAFSTAAAVVALSRLR